MSNKTDRISRVASDSALNNFSTSIKGRKQPLARKKKYPLLISLRLLIW